MFARLTTLLFLAATLTAAAQPAPYTAEQLLAGVKAARPNGGIYARLRMAHTPAGAAKATTLQVQVKRRIAPGGPSEHLYQLLYPADRKGEGILLQIAAGQFTGTTFTPAAGLTPLNPANRTLGLFNTALTIDDVIAEFLDWPSQSLIRTENVGNIPCHLVESKAPDTSKSTARLVRSWIDAKRFVTQKMEVFGTDPAKPLKTVLTEKVLRNKTGYYIPVSFTVTDHATGATTAVEGTRSDTGLTYPDTTFTPQALQNLTTTP
jgi:hypothetical protein